MIGQNKLLNQIQIMSKTNFPRFIILVGNKGSGRKLVSKEISKKINANIINVETKINDIREIITISHNLNTPTIYLFSDTDKMSTSAKNALLKITEEPPKQAYFIMTLQDVNNTLETLRSRGTILYIDPYSSKELIEYTKLKKYELSEKEIKIMTNICTNPGEINILMRYDILRFYNYVEAVVNNIGTVNGANAFKIGTALNYKEDDGGWDITLFLRSIMYIYSQKMKENPMLQYKESIRITSKYLSQLNITGIHKSSTIDMWILEMRGANLFNESC